MYLVLMQINVPEWIGKGEEPPLLWRRGGEKKGRGWDWKDRKKRPVIKIQSE